MVSSVPAATFVNNCFVTVWLVPYWSCPSIDLGVRHADCKLQTANCKPHTGLVYESPHSHFLALIPNTETDYYSAQVAWVIRFGDSVLGSIEAVVYNDGFLANPPS